jgi:hypothetical protein
MVLHLRFGGAGKPAGRGNGNKPNGLTVPIIRMGSGISSRVGIRMSQEPDPNSR